MSTLGNLTNIFKNKKLVHNLLIEHWKPKLICLVLAILVWAWMNFRYVGQYDEWSNGVEVKISVPGGEN